MIRKLHHIKCIVVFTLYYEVEIFLMITQIEKGGGGTTLENQNIHPPLFPNRNFLFNYIKDSVLK